VSTEHTRVLAALDSVPRVGFLPPELRALAGVDRPLPIGYGATNSQPWTVRFMLELLAVPAGGKLLDVGSGSGWTTALLAHLTGPEGSVLGVDIVPELVAWGGENLRSTGLFWARIELAVGRLGAPESGPFDRILVSADAGRIPAELEAQLASGGRMVLPAAGEMWVVDRDDKGFRRVAVPGHHFSFVPLV